MKFFRKILAAMACTLAMTSAHAGIPVIDGAAIANMIMEYQQLMQQYTTLKNQQQTAENTLDAMSGPRGMASLLTNPALSPYLPTEWRDVLGSIKATSAYATERALLPQSANPKVNAIYDNVAANKATMSEYFNRANQRIKQVQQLQAQIDTASDPAAKADLQNRIASEQNSIASTSQLLAVLKERAELDTAHSRQDAQRNIVCREFKNC